MNQSTENGKEVAERNEARLPENIPDAFTMLTAIEKQEKILARRKKALKGFLQQNIPVTGEDEEGRPIGIAQGILMTIFSRGNVSWAKVADKVKTELVPKTRFEEFDAIVEGYTSQTSYPNFKEAEEDNGFEQF